MKGLSDKLFLFLTQVTWHAMSLLQSNKILVLSNILFLLLGWFIDVPVGIDKYYILKLSQKIAVNRFSLDEISLAYDLSIIIS